MSVQRTISRTAGSLLVLLVFSAPASAQAITFSDLEGISVVADIHRDQKNRRQNGIVSVRVHQNWRFSIGADRKIELTVSSTVHTPQGARKVPPNTGTFILDEPRRIPSLGGGEAMWSFADGTLTFVRTFPSGAYRAHFAFTRRGTGL